jgi:hypothetical protein
VDFEAVLYIGARARAHEEDEDAPLSDDIHEAEVAGLEPVQVIIRRGARTVMLDLSLMTVEEIAAVKEVLDQAFKVGFEVSRRLDSVALQALENDEDQVPMRAYRLRPVVVIRDLSVKGITDTKGTNDEEGIDHHV